MSILPSDPVSASKPVANTIASRSKWASVVLMPVASTAVIGVVRTLISATCGLLKVWK